MNKIVISALLLTFVAVQAQEEPICKICIGLLSRGAVDKPTLKENFEEWLQKEVELLQGGDLNTAEGEDLWPLFKEKKTELELLIASPGSQYDDFRRNCGTFQFCAFE